MAALPVILRKTLTWDQGIEMRNHVAIAEAAELDIYFCDPHSPWQRGTNENTNGCYASGLPKLLTCQCFPPTISTTSPPNSTTDPEKHWTGKHPQKPSTNYCPTRSNHPLLHPPPETTSGDVYNTRTFGADKLLQGAPHPRRRHRQLM
jgi:IS30 family transposase